MKIAICDDTEQDRQVIACHLTDFAAKMGLELDLCLYESGEELLDALKKTSFKVIFLDIYMLSLNGIETARTIRKFDKDVQIIFVTTSPDHAIESYDVRALHYMMKPVTYAKLERAINLCQMERIKATRQIEVAVGNRLIPIKLADIFYAEMFKKVLTIHTTHGILETRISLENFELLLGGAPFLACHRSFIVNMDCIAETEADGFMLTNGESVPISRPAKALSIKTYNEYIFSGMRQKLC